MKSICLRLTVLFLALAASPCPAGESRAWTDKNGRVVQAEFVRVEGESVVLRREGRADELTVPMANLSPADRRQAENLAAAPARASTGIGGRLGRMTEGLPIAAMVGIPLALLLSAIWVQKKAAQIMGAETSMLHTLWVMICAQLSQIPFFAIGYLMSAGGGNSSSGGGTILALLGGLTQCFVVGTMYRKGFIGGLLILLMTALLTLAIAFGLLLLAGMALGSAKAA